MPRFHRVVFFLFKGEIAIEETEKIMCSFAKEKRCAHRYESAPVVKLGENILEHLDYLIVNERKQKHLEKLSE